MGFITCSGMRSDAERFRNVRHYVLLAEVSRLHMTFIGPLDKFVGALFESISVAAVVSALLHWSHNLVISMMMTSTSLMPNYYEDQ